MKRRPILFFVPLLIAGVALAGSDAPRRSSREIAAPPGRTVEPPAAPLPGAGPVEDLEDPRLPGRLFVGPDGESVSGDPSIARVWMEELLAAIRLDTPRPTVHARNLFHLSVVMWDAWATFDKEARLYLGGRKQHVPGRTEAELRAAREKAISFAAYRLLKHRFQNGPGAAVTQAALDARLAALGYDASDVDTTGPDAAALGNRTAARQIEAGYADGSNEIEDYRDTSDYRPSNLPLILAFPGTEMIFPNRWQPLAFEYLVLQNGLIIGEATQRFIGPHWGRVTPFALTNDDIGPDWVYLDPGTPPQLDGVQDEAFKDSVVAVLRYSSQLDPTDGAMMDIGPATHHNNPLGTQDGTGHGTNPVTGRPYPLNVVPRGDYGRVLAEYWADGPESETPPGHWNVIFHDMSDSRLLVKRIGGEGPVVDDLAWDVHGYLALNGAMHDAAIGAWGAKGHYDYSRPISQIRHTAGRGQCSDPALPSYAPDGIRLVEGLVELITTETILPGGRHEHLAGEDDENVGRIAVRAWAGAPEDPENEARGVDWILAESWLPFQRETFVTPAFAAYTSGHSTFSRAGAEVLTALTGSPFFPGGLASARFPAGEFLEFEDGPSVDVVLQWATYQDAADEAGVSRLWGGIHVPADDFPGRVMGATIGQRAWEVARGYFRRGVEERPEDTTPTVDAIDLAPATLPGGLLPRTRGEQP